MSTVNLNSDRVVGSQHEEEGLDLLSEPGGLAGSQADEENNMSNDNPTSDSRYNLHSAKGSRLNTPSTRGTYCNEDEIPEELEEASDDDEADDEDEAYVPKLEDITNSNKIEMEDLENGSESNNNITPNPIPTPLVVNSTENQEVNTNEFEANQVNENVPESSYNENTLPNSELTSLPEEIEETSTENIIQRSSPLVPMSIQDLQSSMLFSSVHRNSFRNTTPISSKYSHVSFPVESSYDLNSSTPSNTRVSSRLSHHSNAYQQSNFDSSFSNSYSRSDPRLSNLNTSRSSIRNNENIFSPHRLNGIRESRSGSSNSHRTGISYSQRRIHRVRSAAIDEGESRSITEVNNDPPSNLLPPPMHSTEDSHQRIINSATSRLSGALSEVSRPGLPPAYEAVITSSNTQR